MFILVPRSRAPFGQHQESRPLARSNPGSPRFTDFPSFCACSESSLTNLIGSGLNLLCFQSHSKLECRWTWSEVAILGADQKERGLWGREWGMFWGVHPSSRHKYRFPPNSLEKDVVKATKSDRLCFCIAFAIPLKRCIIANWLHEKQI